jgi:hypothetical protein
MAALLVSSIGRILRESLDCCTYPLAACCELSSRLICSPFTPYLFATLGFNIPPIVWAYKSIEASIRHGPASCFNGTKTIYLWLNAVFAIFHIFGSIYIIVRIQQHQRRRVSEDEDIENIPRTIKRIYSGASVAATIDNSFINSNYRQLASGSPKNDKQLKLPLRIQSVASTLASLNPDRASNDSTKTVDGAIVDDGPPSSFRRLGQVLCYDVGVAGYIVIALIWMLWQSFGLWVVISSAGTDYYNNNNDDDSFDYVNLCGNVRIWVVVSIVCGFAYMSVVFFSFSCSLLCLR